MEGAKKKGFTQIVAEKGADSRRVLVEVMPDGVMPGGVAGVYCADYWLGMFEAGVRFNPADGTRSVFARMIWVSFERSLERKRCAHNLRDRRVRCLPEILRTKTLRIKSAGSKPATPPSIPWPAILQSKICVHPRPFLRQSA